MTRITDQQPTGWDRAKFRKSSRSDSSANGNCVAAAVDGSAVAVGDTKLPTSDGSFQHLVVDREDWAGLVRAVR